MTTTTKKEITLEIKKAIAYQYFNNQYIYKNDYGTYSGEVGDFHTNDHITNKHFKLVLKHINTLTRVDALAVSSILKARGDAFVEDKIQDTVIRLITRDNPLFEHANPLLYLHAIQYLQSKGYAMPYMEYSVNDLIEAGIFYVKPVVTKK